MEPRCIMQFRREDHLRVQLLLDSHKVIVLHYRLPHKAATRYKKSLEDDGLQ